MAAGSDGNEAKRLCARAVSNCQIGCCVSCRADFPPESNACCGLVVCIRLCIWVATSMIHCERRARFPRRLACGKGVPLCRLRASDALCCSAVHPPFRVTLTAREVSKPDMVNSLNLGDSARVVFLVAVCFRLSKTLLFSLRVGVCVLTTSRFAINLG